MPRAVYRADDQLVGVIRDIHRWAVANDDKIERAFSFIGGWEGWAQVEIQLMLETNWPLYQIEREAHIYAAADKKVDLLLSPHGGGGPYTAVELKCESFLQSRVIGGLGIGLYNAMATDITKAALPLAPQYAGQTTLFVVGIGGTGYIDTDDFRNMFYAQLQRPVNRGHWNNLYTFWREFDK